MGLGSAVGAAEAEEIKWRGGYRRRPATVGLLGRLVRVWDVTKIKLAGTASSVR
jgi:hypothetical protein